MAVKTKKRKLANNRQDQETNTVNPQDKAEAELQRQEEQMLAVSRLLKQVDTKEALTVTKIILENSTATSSSDETNGSTGTSGNTEAVNGATTVSNDLAAHHNDTSSNQGSSSRQSRRSKSNSHLQHEDTNNVTPPLYSQRETRSRAAVASPTAINGITNGLESRILRGTSSEGKENEGVIESIATNMQKLSDSHVNEDRQPQGLKIGDSTPVTPTNGSSGGEVVRPVLRSGRRRTAALGTPDSANSEGELDQQEHLEAPLTPTGLDLSNVTTPFVASVISEPSASTDPDAEPNISVIFRTEGDIVDTSSKQAFDIPISALAQPRLTKSLIQQKARSTYAPQSVIQTDQPRRRPGRPPGYFLGPTSCAYCRAQHRRCDFNTVCIRCIKAKIPCDRSGTVDRPTIIVREARQQAKAEAAAALAAAVAAGLAIAPEKPRPANRYTQLHALTIEAASITSKLPSPGESSPSAGVKRRRTPSPSDVSRGNIIEQRVKRLASVRPIEKFDPSIYSKPQIKQIKVSNQSERKLVNGKRMNSEDRHVDGSESSSSSISLIRKPGRPATKAELATKLSLKRSVGRPPSTKKPSLNSSSSAKFDDSKRKPGRPPKTSSGSSTNALLKRDKVNSSSSRGKLTSHTKSTKGKRPMIESDDEESEVVRETLDKPSVRLVRKMYLKSGLYSADLKVNPSNNSKLAVTLKQASKQSTKQAPTSKALVIQNKRTARNGDTSHSGSSGSFFPLPINYGSVLTSNQKDFRLPFDIMQAWQAGLLRKAIQPEAFIKIRSNIFLERKRRTETSPMVCHCTPPPPGAGRVGCGEDCYNRVMFYECVSAHCPCGDQCSNQRFQKKHSEDHLRVFWTQERGFGVQTLKPIKKGSLVIEYRGEVISQTECHRRMESIYKNNKNFYFLEYEKGEVVDACQKGTNARFVNHSCSPNSQIEKWFLNGEMSIGIFASQDIPVGAEISYDYNFSSFSGAQKQKCRCGAPNCRGYIGERISKAKEPINAPVAQGKSGKKAGARKHKAGRRRVYDQESSVRLTQMPSIKQIRQRLSNKYKEDKMAAIRYTKLFLFRNIRLVESKYIKYARTKSRSFQETVSRPWLSQARQCRKRSLEGVIDDLRNIAKEREEEGFREQSVESTSSRDDDASDPSVSVTAEDSMIELVLEMDDTDADAMDEYDHEHYGVEDDDEEEEVDELEDDDDNDDDDDDDESAKSSEDELEEDELEDDRRTYHNPHYNEDKIDELESESD
ncbi:Histone-Lysine N-Methyltransferase ash1l [Entomortierella beljakovae]|nr:Histone-Lysine N-Methyltransferase ash1l [Entomortierella beljakovae]